MATKSHMPPFLKRMIDLMKVFQVIPYWTDTITGANYVNSNNYCLKVGSSYEAVYQWAKINTKQFHFKPDYLMSEAQLAGSFQFDLAVKEVEMIILHDIADTEYRADVKLISKIETRRIEVPLDDSSHQK